MARSAPLSVGGSAQSSLRDPSPGFASLAALYLLASGCCCPLLGENRSEPATQGPPIAPPITATAYDPQFIATHLASARAEAGCDAAPSGAIGLFCPALRGWDGGSQGVLPIGPVALAGVTTWIPTSGSFAEADARLRRLSFLGLRSDGTGRYGRLISPQGESPQEIVDTAQALSLVVASAQSGAGAPIAIEAGLHGFANGQAGQASYAIAGTGQGWQLQGGSLADVRRVGNVWVAIEVPRNAPAGLYFSIFVDAPITPR